MNTDNLAYLQYKGSGKYFVPIISILTFKGHKPNNVSETFGVVLVSIMVNIPLLTSARVHHC